MRTRDWCRRGTELPKECEVVVIGGGITGTATAYYLSGAGVPVSLLESSDLNTQASGRNAGSLHGQIQFEPFLTRPATWGLDFLPALSFLADSVSIWRDLGTELEADLEVSLNGGLLVADTDEQVEHVAAKVALETSHGFVAELVTGSDLRRLAPYVSSEVIAAEYCPGEGKANPLVAAPAFARAAGRRGARIYTGTEVTTVEPVPDGFAVRTATSSIRCAKVVIAAGSQLAALAAQVGIHVPITDEPVQVHATESVAPVIPHLVYYAGGRLTLKQARAGTVLVGGGWPARVDPGTGHASPSLASMRANLAVAQRIAPWLGSVNVIRAWAGVGHGTPDLLPIIQESRLAPGAFVGLFPHMGLTAGPLMGQVLAAMVVGRDPGRDLSAFSSQRLDH